MGHLVGTQQSKFADMGDDLMHLGEDSALLMERLLLK
jgi:hypothetical protein